VKLAHFAHKQESISVKRQTNNNMTTKFLLHKDVKEKAKRTSGTFGFAPTHEADLT